MAGVAIATRVPTPHFDAGVVASALGHAGVSPRVCVAHAGPEGHRLRVEW